LSSDDQSRDEQSLDPQSVPSGKKPGEFTRRFSSYSANSNIPAPGHDPYAPQGGDSGYPVNDSQPDLQVAKAKPGEFTRVFSQRPPAPGMESANVPADPAHNQGTASGIFGNRAVPPQERLNVDSFPGFAKPEPVEPAPARPPVNPIPFPESGFSHHPNSMRAPFEERTAVSRPEEFNDIFQNPRQPSDNGSFPKFQGPGAFEMPVNPQPASNSYKRPNDLFGEDKPNLNAAKMPGGPSEYTRVHGSGRRSPQENEGAVPPSSSPQENVAQASQAPYAYPMPQMQMPQMPQAPIIQMPQMPQAQMMPGSPMMTPMMQMPSVAVGALPQASLPAPMPLQPLPQEAGKSKWAAYMPAIIALNVFFLLAVILIVIVVLASKK